MADLYEKKLSGTVQVTDYKWVDGNNKKRFGFTMNRILWTNIQGIPKYLEHDHSMVIIISGSGLKRVGKSYLARQIAYAARWCLDGGNQDPITDEILSVPDKQGILLTRFSAAQLANDVSMSAEQYGIYILDESSAVAGSQTSRSRINREFRDLITRSAMRRMVLILVLPDYFELDKNWACVESDCLINVKTIAGRRGYFDFYNRQAKERLYFWGKKKIGEARYSATTSWPTFHGEFGNMFPGDKTEYDIEKEMSLIDLNKTNKHSTTIQRDHIIKKIQETTGWTYDELSKNLDVPYDTIHGSIQRENVRLKSNKPLIENNNAEENDNDLLEGGNTNGEQGTGEKIN